MFEHGGNTVQIRWQLAMAHGGAVPVVGEIEQARPDDKNDKWDCEKEKR